MYNFGVPAHLKSWIDQICRVGQTFRYTENGPQGLLQNRPVFLVISTGGAKVGSEVDFVSHYLRQALQFVGISVVQVIAADQTGANRDQALERARGTMEELAGHYHTARAA